jgi:hypothetical protein
VCCGSMTEMQGGRAGDRRRRWGEGRRMEGGRKGGGGGGGHDRGALHARSSLRVLDLSLWRF